MQQRGLGVGVQFAAQSHNSPGHIDNAFDHFPVTFLGEFDQSGMAYSGADQLNVHDHIVSTPQCFDKKMFSETNWNTVLCFPAKTQKNPSRCPWFYLLKSNFLWAIFQKKKKTFSGQGYILL